MAIKPYTAEGKRVFEVYLNGFDSNGNRVQRRKRGIDSLKKAETIEFEFKRELSVLKEQRPTYRFSEWFDECMRRMKLEFMPSTIAGYETQVRKWVHR